MNGKSICTIRSDIFGPCRSGTNRLFLFLLVYGLCGQIVLLVMAVCFQSPGLGVVLGFKGIADGGVKPAGGFPWSLRQLSEVRKAQKTLKKVFPFLSNVSKTKRILWNAVSYRFNLVIVNNLFFMTI